MTDMPDVIYADAPVSSDSDGEWRATPDELATKYIRADKAEKLRDALAALVGVESKEELEELEQMEFIIRSQPAPDADKAVVINAIHALLEVLNRD